jgi:hypothetical protein
LKEAKAEEAKDKTLSKEAAETPISEEEPKNILPTFVMGTHQLNDRPIK